MSEAEYARRSGIWAVELDERKQRLPEGTISGAASAVRVSVIPANEELGVARQTYGYIEKMEG